MQDTARQNLFVKPLGRRYGSYKGMRFSFSDLRPMAKGLPKTPGNRDTAWLSKKARRVDQYFLVSPNVFESPWFSRSVRVSHTANAVHQGGWGRVLRAGHERDSWGKARNGRRLRLLMGRNVQTHGVPEDGDGRLSRGDARKRGSGVAGNAVLRIAWAGWNV